MIVVSQNLQEIFDVVSNHLLTQMKRSDKPGPTNTNNCMYLGPNGLKCAAGILIPEDQYNPEFEGKSWEDLTLNGHVQKNHVIPISELQNIHDWTEPQNWKFELVAFAEQYKLNHNIKV